MSLLHLFDLLKKGYFSLPFLAIIALLFFLHNLSFFVFKTMPLSLYTVSGNVTIPTFPVNTAQLFKSFLFSFSIVFYTSLPLALTANLINEFLHLFPSSIRECLFGVNIYTSLPLALIAYLINEFIAPF